MKLPNALGIGVLVVAWLVGCGQTAAQPELWVYAPGNLLVPTEVERLEGVMRTAAKAGYTHVLIADSKFARLGQMEERYFKHVQRIRKTAEQLHLKIVPAIFPVGYSNDLLSQNPNLAEALPVRGATFVVNNKTAQVAPDPAIALPKLSETKKWGFIDEPFKLEEQQLHARPPYNGNVRIMKPLELRPFHHYHVSVRVKTANFNAAVEIKALAPNGKSLSWTSLGAKPTQDWTAHDITFNSLDNTKVNLYIGAWGPTAGELWLADPKIEPCGAVNLVRRSGAPIKVEQVAATGKKELKEGVDFYPWSDPKMGIIPFPGEYEVWHEAPPIRLKRPLPNGTKLAVSYYHVHTVYQGQVSGAIDEPEFEQTLLDQAERLAKIFPGSDWMMSHDEYRVMGWDETEGSRRHKPAESLTRNAKVCFEKLKKISPKCRVFTWSDMFDPFHNAIDNYYLVNGDLSGAALEKDVIVMNWNFDKRAESLRHFAERGHQQIIAGYYDADPAQIAQWLDTVVQEKIPNVIGVMYTTWTNDHGDLEEFARLVQAHAWFQSAPKPFR